MEIKDRCNMTSEEAAWLLDNEPGVELRNHVNGMYCRNNRHGGMEYQRLTSQWELIKASDIARFFEPPNMYYVVKDGERKPKPLTGAEALAESARTGKVCEIGERWYRFDDDQLFWSPDRGENWGMTWIVPAELLAANCRMVDRSEWFDMVKEQPKREPEIVPLPESLSEESLGKFEEGSASLEVDYHHLCTELSTFLQGVMDAKIEAALKVKEEHE